MGTQTHFIEILHLFQKSTMSQSTGLPMTLLTIIQMMLRLLLPMLRLLLPMLRVTLTMSQVTLETVLVLVVTSSSTMGLGLR
jgi:hypothetical protein